MLIQGVLRQRRRLFQHRVITAGTLISQRAWLLLLLVLSCATPLDCAATDKPDARVLFINSYHRGYAWSDSIEQGLRDRLNSSGKNIELSFEYLDSRRFTYGEQIRLMSEAMALKYARYHPDLIIVSDNAAFEFAIKYRSTLFPGLPIVFCGYNDFRPEVLNGITNITGVNEEFDIAGGVQMALKVHPQTRNLVFITSAIKVANGPVRDRAEQAVFDHYKQRFNVLELKDASIEEIREHLSKLSPETVLFIIGQVRGRILTPRENSQLISAASPFPAYAFGDYLDTGIIAGHVLDGANQGKAAANLALRILAGTPASKIPVLAVSPSTDIFDYKVMQRFGVTPAALPPDAIIVNRPFSLWDSYRWQIIVTLTLLLLQTSLIGVLVRITRGRRKALADLANERALLESRVRERTAELEQANEQLAVLSFSDGLTQLANRRRFDDVLEAEFRRLRRGKTPLSLILLDIDHFKKFNDTYGHVAGDECLRQVAALISHHVNRVTDLAARYGGEEFGIILPQTDMRGAAALAERIREAIAQLGTLPKHPDMLRSVTASFGVVTIEIIFGGTSKDLLKLVDEQLYEAKANGRNQVVTKNIGG